MKETRRLDIVVQVPEDATDEDILRIARRACEDAGVPDARITGPTPLARALTKAEETALARDGVIMREGGGG